MGCVSLTFCLLMIVSYFAEPLWGSVKGYWIYWGLMKLHLVNLSTDKKHLYFSALTPNRKWEGLYNKSWGQGRWRIVKNIWDYLWCVENQRLISLRSFRKKSLKGWWGGRKSLYLRQVGRFWLRRLAKLYLPIPWVNSNCLMPFVTKSTPSYQITGGAKPRMKRRSVGLIGKIV